MRHDSPDQFCSSRVRRQEEDHPPRKVPRPQKVIPWARLIAVIEPFYRRGPAANVADVTKTSALLHGEESPVHADAGSTGVEKRAEIVALERKIDWQIGAKRAVIKAMEGAEQAAVKAVEKAKASVRAFVEHPFHIVKNIFKHRKVRYLGLAKNGHQLYVLFGLANVVIGACAQAAA